MERNNDLAGGGTEGGSELFRFPRWSVAGAATYPQNTESRCRQESGGDTGREQSSAGTVSAQAEGEEEGRGLS